MSRPRFTSPIPQSEYASILFCSTWQQRELYNKLGAIHCQRACIYAIQSDKKKMLAELQLALSGGNREPTALDGEEFQPYRADPEFEALAAKWKIGDSR